MSSSTRSAPGPGPSSSEPRFDDASPVAHVRAAARLLDAHCVASPRVEAEALLMHALGVGRAELYAGHGALDAASGRWFARALRRRCEGVPLQHLTGEQAFLDLTLEVRPGVFVSRPETETLVERALESIEGRSGPVVADVGTGAGAIALAVKFRRPDAKVQAIDRSMDAVALARENASRHGLDIAVREGDLLSPLPEALRGRLDLVVSNPPYVTEQEYGSLPPEVRRDPYEALVGGTEIHRRLAEEAPRWIRSDGWLVMEIGASQGSEARDILTRGFVDVEVLPDPAGHDRIVRGRLPAHG